MRPGKYPLAALAAFLTLLPAAPPMAASPDAAASPAQDIKRAEAFVARMARVNGCILSRRRADQMIPFSTPTGYDPWAVPVMPNENDEGCSRPFRIGGWRQDDKGRLVVTVDFVSQSGHYTRVNYHLQKYSNGSFLAVFER